jgi:hypothetical protein
MALPAAPFGASWRERYRSPAPIRCRGALHFFTARDPISDRLRTIVTAPQLPLSEARSRLANLARVHRLVAGPHVPATAEHDVDGPAPWVALDCDAIADLETVQDYVRRGGEKPDFVRGAVLGKTIMETLVACHDVRDPEGGRPMCLGSLARGNVLFSADGTMWLVGFGAGPLGDACIAPEVAAGGAPTPGADVYAVMLFLRAQLEHVRLPSVLRRVFAGRSPVKDARFVVLLAWSNLKILAAPSAMRPDMKAALARAREMWRLLDIEPDVDGFAAWVSLAIASAPPVERAVSDAPPCIVVGGDGEWLATLDGTRHALGSRGPLRRLIVALAEAHRDRAGAALTVDELVHVGWPGENPIPKAGSNRVYVAISTLRGLGLGPLLQRWDGGYRLDPRAQCRFEDGSFKEP